MSTAVVKKKLSKRRALGQTGRALNFEREFISKI